VRKINRKTGTKIKGISPAARQLFLKHSWPGNVRELENVMERAMILAEKEIILPENLPGNLGGKGGDRRLDDIFGGFSLKKAQKIMEARLISRALDATGGNKSKASELLELSYPSLLSKIKEYEI
jgi:two-component system response regulator AtoC